MIERIFLEGKEIVLVGTAHVSNESVKLVEKTILEEKPQSTECAKPLNQHCPVFA